MVSPMEPSVVKDTHQQLILFSMKYCSSALSYNYFYSGTINNFTVMTHSL